MKEIIEIVANYYGLWQGKIFMKSRIREIMIPRQVAHYVLRRHSKFNLKEISGYFGINHATVIHSVKTVENDIDTNPRFKKDVEAIVAIIKYGHPEFFTKLETVKKIHKTICNPCKY